MRVRFREPQPGTFYVGSPHGSFVFQNGYNDDIPEAVYQAWKESGLAIVPCDISTKTPDVETPPDVETVTPPAKKTAAPKARTTRATTKRTGARRATARA